MARDANEFAEKALLTEMPHILGPMISPYSGRTIRFEDLHLELHPDPEIYKKFIILAINSGIVPILDPFAKKVFEFDIKKDESRKVPASKYKDVFTKEIIKIITKEVKETSRKE